MPNNPVLMLVLCSHVNCHGGDGVLFCHSCAFEVNLVIC